MPTHEVPLFTPEAIGALLGDLGVSADSRNELAMKLLGHPQHWRPVVEAHMRGLITALSREQADVLSGSADPDARAWFQTFTGAGGTAAEERLRTFVNRCSTVVSPTLDALAPAGLDETVAPLRDCKFVCPGRDFLDPLVADRVAEASTLAVAVALGDGKWVGLGRDAAAAIKDPGAVAFVVDKAGARESLTFADLAAKRWWLAHHLAYRFANDAAALRVLVAATEAHIRRLSISGEVRKRAEVSEAAAVVGVLAELGALVSEDVLNLRITLDYGWSLRREWVRERWIAGPHRQTVVTGPFVNTIPRQPKPPFREKPQDGALRHKPVWSLWCEFASLGNARGLATAIAAGVNVQPPGARGDLVAIADHYGLESKEPGAPTVAQVMGVERALALVEAAGRAALATRPSGSRYGLK